MRVLVCGGRNYADQAEVYRALDNIHWPSARIKLVITGGAKGADRHAESWAGWCAVPCNTYPADWHTHGLSAGPRRNKLMLDEGKPDLVLAFPGGLGTLDMVRRAIKAGVPVTHYPRPAPSHERR